MSAADNIYKLLLNEVLVNGIVTPSRAGETKRIFGASLCFYDVTECFPLLTLRKLHPKGMLGELAGFLRGTDKLQDFKNFGCNYWDQNAAAWIENTGLPVAEQRVGKIYGYKWRKWNDHYDQLTMLVDGLKRDPLSRRHLLTTFDPAETDMCLPPCHLLAQFSVQEGKWLDCVVFMRSVDLVLGLPSDAVVYATLMHLIAEEVGLTAATLTFMFGDTHIYTQHIPAAYEMLSREGYDAPIIDFSEASLFDFHPKHVSIEDYYHDKAIELQLNV